MPILGQFVPGPVRAEAKTVPMGPIRRGSKSLISVPKMVSAAQTFGPYCDFGATAETQTGIRSRTDATTVINVRMGAEPVY